MNTCHLRFARALGLFLVLILAGCAVRTAIVGGAMAPFRWLGVVLTPDWEQDAEGLLNGEGTLTYDSGAVRAKGTYLKDEEEGLWTFYYPNGQVETVGLTPHFPLWGLETRALAEEMIAEGRPHIAHALELYMEALYDWSCTTGANPDLYRECGVNDLGQYINGFKQDVLADPVAYIEVKQAQEDMISITVKIIVEDENAPVDFYYTRYRHEQGGYEIY